MEKLKCLVCGADTEQINLKLDFGICDTTIASRWEDDRAVCQHCMIDAVKKLDDREKNECHCEDQYTVEPHGDKFAVYFGRCPHRHGKRILSFMPDGSDVVTGETTTIEAFQFKGPEITDFPEEPEIKVPNYESIKISDIDLPEPVDFDGMRHSIAKLTDKLAKKKSEITSLKKQLEDHKDAIFFYREANKLFKSFKSEEESVVKVQFHGREFAFNGDKPETENGDTSSIPDKPRYA